MTLSNQTETLYLEIDKIDAHMHLNCNRSALQDEAKNEGFSLITINTEAPFFPDIKKQKEIALACGDQFRSSLNFITTFDTQTWGSPDWADRVIEQIEQGIGDGAVAVKIWKNIGMELRKGKGNFLMADHPSFDPVYHYLSINEIPLLAHLGEPKNCWLPLEEMTVTSDRDYFSGHPQYHMYLHPGYPSYQDQLAARDRVLEKHPKLIFIGAHLASIEWSVDELARWLDGHPQCGVDLAERVCHLQHQAVTDPQKVKEFVEAYQDRIIYGTDQIDDGSAKSEEIRAVIRKKWHNEFRFFSGNDIQTAWNVEKPFRGLALEKKILQKLYRDNAIKYYPGLVNGRQ